MLLSIVVPVYKEEKNIPEFLRRLRPILSGVTEDYEIIFSLDPSPDRTEDVILEARVADPRIKLLRFSRRFGQPMATLAGLEYSTGEAVVAMDVDLQDPPELIHEMVAKWREGYDVVLPQRRARTGEPWIKTLVAATGYKVINKIADVKIPPNTGDFRLMARRVVADDVGLHRDVTRPSPEVFGDRPVRSRRLVHAHAPTPGHLGRVDLEGHAAERRRP